MIFTAVIRPGSSIDRMWVGHNRCAGTVNGVRFDKQGSVFVSGDLTPDQYLALNAHPCVRIEVCTTVTIEPLPQPLNITVEGGLAPPAFRPKPKGKPARK